MLDTVVLLFAILLALPTQHQVAARSCSSTTVQQFKASLIKSILAGDRAINTSKAEVWDGEASTVHLINVTVAGCSPDAPACASRRLRKARALATMLTSYVEREWTGQWPVPGSLRLVLRVYHLDQLVQPEAVSRDVAVAWEAIKAALRQNEFFVRGVKKEILPPGGTIPVVYWIECIPEVIQVPLVKMGTDCNYYVTNDLHSSTTLLASDVVSSIFGMGSYYGLWATDAVCPGRRPKCTS